MNHEGSDVLRPAFLLFFLAGTGIGICIGLALGASDRAPPTDEVSSEEKAEAATQGGPRLMGSGDSTTSSRRTLATPAPSPNETAPHGSAQHLDPEPAKEAPEPDPDEEAPLSYEDALRRVRHDVTDEDLISLLGRQILPGLGRLHPPVSERQRAEMIECLRTTARDYLLPERVDVQFGLKGRLEEDAYVQAIRAQHTAMTEARRWIRERILTREQEEQLPSHWRE